MSYIITKEFSGEQDIGSITATEMFELMLEYDIKRFNTFEQMWKVILNPGTDEEEEVLISWENAKLKEAETGVKNQRECTNTWEIDIN